MYYLVLLALILSVLFFLAFVIALVRRSKKWKRNLTLWFVCLIAFFVLLLLTPSSDSDKPATAEQSTTDVTEETSNSDANKEAVIADNEYVTATFERIYDAENLGVKGVFYIDIKAVNKTDTDIWVYLENASVNDEMVPMVMSGTPLYINAQKSGKNGFIISFEPLSIDNIKDVRNVEFDLVIADRNSLAEMSRVSGIRLDF